MPAKNSIKTYVPKSYYHIYNRGVEKRSIFQDEQDYGVFLSYLKSYLLPKDEGALRQTLSNPAISAKERDRILKLLRLNNFANEITLLAYCLMPNHFHLLVKQNSEDGIDRFMNSLSTRYTMFFNRKYKRIGPLYQDVYKAVLVESNEQLLYLTHYIHRNPAPYQPRKDRSIHKALFRQPSSYSEYLGKRQTFWVRPEEILKFFSKTSIKLSYQAFVEDTNELGSISRVAIDF
ncbi:MAG: hypothetical protein CEO21_266 [Microgenomates group bacterium Gr01-1014_80]|nr:MAG: hypothetical protein CEO21_266 [Microgenomates group bacterium Gr01-1014_80]